MELTVRKISKSVLTDGDKFYEGNGHGIEMEND